MSTLTCRSNCPKDCGKIFVAVFGAGFSPALDLSDHLSQIAYAIIAPQELR